MAEEPQNIQSDPHETVNPPDVHERHSPLQTVGQTITGLSALAIFALIATPVVLIVACIVLALLAL